MRNRHELLTSQELAYVIAWSGDGSAAAAAAGYKQPAVRSAHLLQRPRVMKAVLQKQEELVRASALRMIFTPEELEKLKGLLQQSVERDTAALQATNDAICEKGQG